MFRNSTVVPYLALVASVALAFVTWAERRRVAEVTGHWAPSLSSIQLALLAFSALLVVYGTVGLLSVWLEGSTLRPGIRSEIPRLAALVVAVVASLAMVVLAAFLAFALLSDLHGARIAPLLEGWIVGALSFLCALVFTVYRKYFMRSEVIVEEEDSEVPW